MITDIVKTGYYDLSVCPMFIAVLGVCCVIRGYDIYNTSNG